MGGALCLSWSRALSKSDKGGVIAAGCFDRITRLLDAQTGHVLADLPHGGRVVCAALACTRPLLATGASDCLVRFFRSSSRGLATNMVEGFQIQMEGTVTGICWSPAGEQVAASCRDGTV